MSNSDTTEAERDASKHARALSVLGARKGGLARREAMTQEERRESARRAAEARWAAEKGIAPIPRATHTGKLKIGNIECAVLQTGERVLSERGLLNALGIRFGGALAKARQSDDGAADLPLFVGFKNLRPFIDNDLAVLLSNPVKYRPQHGGVLAHGVRAEIVPRVCNVWLRARDADVLRLAQKRVALKADIIMRALAEVGIIALIDDATGHRADLAKDEYAKIFAAFVAKELQPWLSTFPSDFYEELFRLRGFDFNGGTRRPAIIGKDTDDIVYKRLAPGVRKELLRLNPKNDKGRRKYKNFQWLTKEQGYQKLLQHLHATIALMRASEDFAGFKRFLNRALPVQPDGPTLFDPEDVEEPLLQA